MATISGDLSTGLVSVWEMESGALTTDSHGSNTLTDNNTVGSGTGIQGGCGDFELANSEFLSIADNASLSITGDLTLALWVKRESDAGQALMGKFNGNGGASERSYMFYIDGNTSTDLSLNISDGSTATWKYVSATLNTGTWYHIAVVYTASAGSAKFYVNGSQQGTTQTGLPTSITNNSIAFGLGAAAQNSASSAWGSYFDGLIDQACIWAAALSDANISTLYNSGAGIPYAAAASGPATLKTWNTIAKASIKTLDTIAIASIKTIDTLA